MYNVVTFTRESQYSILLSTKKQKLSLKLKITTLITSKPKSPSKVKIIECVFPKQEQFRIA